MRSFRRKVVVITGAGSGIGRATARAFANREAIVHVVDIAGERAREVVAELRLAGAEAFDHTVDCRAPSEMEALAERVFERHGRTDVLVNNAGVGVSGHVHEMSLDDWKWVVDTNLWGVIHGLHAFVPRMIDQGGGAHIVNVSSILGLMGLPTMSAYCASKYAVVGITECLASELAPFGIDVTVVCPGIIDTDIVRSARVSEAIAANRTRALDFYRRFGIPPERVARDILRAIKARRVVQLTVGGSYPALLLHRIAPRLFHGVARIAHGRILGGGS